MSVLCRHEGDTLTLSGEIDFGNAGEALDQGRRAIESTARLKVDLSGVSRSNSAGLALLIEWLGIARRCGHSVSFAGVPHGLQQLAEVCQVDGLLKAT